MKYFYILKYSEIQIKVLLSNIWFKLCFKKDKQKEKNQNS